MSIRVRGVKETYGIPEWDALQWTGENRLEMRMFLNGDRIGGALHFTGNGFDDILIPARPFFDRECHKGDWVLREHDGSYSVVPEDTFWLMYQEVKRP